MGFREDLVDYGVLKGNPRADRREDERQRQHRVDENAFSALADRVADIASLVVQDEEDEVRDRKHRQADRRREDREPHRQRNDDAENADARRQRKQAEPLLRHIETEHFAHREAARDHMNADRAAAHPDKTQAKDDVAERNPVERFRGFERFHPVENDVGAGVNARRDHPDHNQRGNDHERQEHRHSQVPTRQRLMFRAPTFRKKRIRVEERHIDPDRRAEHPENLQIRLRLDDAGFRVRRNPVIADKALEEFDPVHVPDVQNANEQEEENDERDHRSQKAFVNLNAGRALAVIENDGNVHRQNQRSGDKADGVSGPGQRAALSGDRHSGGSGQVASGAGDQAVLRKVPNDRRRYRPERPKEDERFPNLLTERFIRAFAARQDDVRERAEHKNAEKHRERLHPKELVSERSPGQNGRGRAPGAKRHRALKEARPGAFDVSERTRPQRERRQAPQFRFFGGEFFRVPFRAHREPGVGGRRPLRSGRFFGLRHYFFLPFYY